MQQCIVCWLDVATSFNARHNPLKKSESKRAAPDGTRRFITILTKALHWFLFTARRLRTTS